MKKKIELANGFKCTIDDGFLDDIEFAELLADTEEKPFLIGRVAEAVFGKEQKKKLYDYLKAKDGRARISAISDVIEEVFNNMGGEAKN